MTDKRTGISQRTYARQAGFMYLFVLIVDLSGLPLLSRAGNSHFVGQCCHFLLSVLESRYIPGVMSLWGILASLIVVANCINHLLQPQYPVMISGYLWLPMLIAEIFLRKPDQAVLIPRRLLLGFS